jgi:paraquat-inducible protein A
MSEVLVACHDCDLLQREPEVPRGGSARCPRCNAELWRHRPNSIERTLALTIAGLVLFVVANAFPFLGFDMQGQVTQTTLSSGVRQLYAQDQWLVGSLVLFTTIAAPALQLGMLVYVLAPLQAGRRAPGFVHAFRWLQHLRPWSMMEVFLIGILVSLVKLADMATIEPGLSLWAFALLIPILAGALASLDAREVWDQVEVER